MGAISRILDASWALPSLPVREWYAHIKRAIETEPEEEGQVE